MSNDANRNDMPVKSDAHSSQEEAPTSMAEFAFEIFCAVIFLGMIGLVFFLAASLCVSVPVLCEMRRDAVTAQPPR